MKYVFEHFYFIIGILIAIILAEIAPWIGCRGGPMAPEFTVKYLAVSLIFYISGVTLKASDFSEAFKMIWLHLFIQMFSFIFTPMFIHIFLLICVEPFGLNEWILKGLVTVGCMPPAISSAVILTKAAGGNVAAAIFNATVGSFLGMILTPLLLLCNVGLTTTLPVFNTLIQLTQTVICPLLVGQLSQMIISNKLLSQIPLSFLAQLSLLYIIYTSLCDIFIQDDYIIDAHHVLVTVLLVLVIQLALIYLCFKLTTSLGYFEELYTNEDAMAILFCSTHKSLGLGMPLLRILYSGYSHLSQISLPLLIYHPMQLILGGLLVPLAKQWMANRSKCRR